MAVFPTQGNEIIVDAPGSAKAADFQPGASLVSYVVGTVGPWEDQRDRGYKTRWAEYWRLWRGMWSAEDANRQSERSRLIAPALAQSIDSAVSEVEEALFGREVWFDISDDLADQNKSDAAQARDFLLEDLDTVNARDAIVEAVQNAAIFGTGVVKISPYVRTSSKPKRDPETFRMEKDDYERVYVCLESIRPDEFIPDPAGRTIEEMHGCAHRVQKPLHAVLEKIASGLYRKDALKFLFPQQRTDNVDVDDNDPQSMLAATDAEQVSVLEYHGKVPLRLLTLMQDVSTEADVMLQNATNVGSVEEDDELVEAIVTIANDSVLLRAMINPFTMEDRSIVAFPYERVPGRFWGRGVAEKGYNPQKALDAEIRARIDALGYISAPMLAIDAGRVPRGFKLEIKPGKLWMTQGPPGEALAPVSIGDINAATFNQASEMERMVQMGTGTFDSATALKQQSQSGASGVSANSMFMGSFVKRAKRCIQNVDRNLVTPVIKKVMWRYMQFEPRRYPKDVEFNVKATVGIVAREVEAAQLTQMLGMMKAENFPQTSMAIVQGIIDHTSVVNKAQIEKAMQADMQPKPPTPEQQELQRLQIEAAKGEAIQVLLDNNKTIAETKKLLAETEAALKKSGIEEGRLMAEMEQLRQNWEEIRQFSTQNQIAMRNLELKDRELDIKEKALTKKPAA